MTGKGVGALVIAAALAVGSGTGAGAASRATCTKPRGYVVKTKTREAVVFTNRDGYRAYGCLYARAVLVRLAGAVSHHRLAGPYVAYFMRFEEVGQSYYRVAVRDLRTGDFRHIEAARSDLPERGGADDGESAARVKGLTLKRNGSVAWISCFESRAGSCAAPASDLEWQVWRADARGRRLLDASEDVRLRSLQRAGSTLTWRHGDETRTARLR
jgi:hypothetical protein